MFMSQHGKILLTIQRSSYPVENGSPKVYPPDELQIIRRVWLAFYNIEYSLVKHRDRSCNTSDAKRLGTEHGEYEGGHERRQQDFRDTILLRCLY